MKVLPQCHREGALLGSGAPGPFFPAVPDATHSDHGGNAVSEGQVRPPGSVPHGGPVRAQDPRAQGAERSSLGATSSTTLWGAGTRGQERMVRRAMEGPWDMGRTLRQGSVKQIGLTGL